MDTEVWEVITESGLPANAYAVSNHGRVRSLDRRVPNRENMMFVRGVLIKPFMTNSCYLSVSLSGKHKKLYIHRLVCKYHVNHGRDLEGVVNHKDWDKTNNHHTNLEMVTQSFNEKHKYLKPGFTSKSAKLDKDTAEKIRGSYREGGISQKKLAEQHGISTMVVNRIINNVQQAYT